MNLQLDPHVRAAFDAIVANAPDLGAAPEPAMREPERSPRRAWLAVAATLVLLAGVAGLAVLRPQRSQTSPAAPPTAPPLPAPTLPQPTIPGNPAVLPERLPVDWATTHDTLPRWPEVSVSDVAATVTGFGLYVCDSGTATFHTSLTSGDGPEYSYYGTLCPFIRLMEPRFDSTAICGTVSDGLHFARCQREPVPAGQAEGTTVASELSDDLAAPISDLPNPAAETQPAPFGSAVSGLGGEPVSDDGVSVVLRAADGVDAAVWGTEAVCYLIGLPGAIADGCHWPGELASGLLYGLFRDRTAGAIDVVGIVPDDVISVTLTGTTESWSVAPVRNVWHVSVPAGEAFEITVAGADGRQATTAAS